MWNGIPGRSGTIWHKEPYIIYPYIHMHACMVIYVLHMYISTKIYKHNFIKVCCLGTGSHTGTILLQSWYAVQYNTKWCTELQYGMRHCSSTRLVQYGIDRAGQFGLVRHSMVLHVRIIMSIFTGMNPTYCLC